MRGYRTSRRLPAVIIALNLFWFAVPEAQARPASTTRPATAQRESKVARETHARARGQGRVATPERQATKRHASRGTNKGGAHHRLPRTRLDREQPGAQARAATVSASLVQTIDMSILSPPSSDASDVAYDPVSDRLVVVDGEIEEPNMAWLYQGANIWSLTRQGVVLSTGSTTLPNTQDYSKEPVGAGFIPETNTLMISDDNLDDLIFVKAGADGVFGNSNDNVLALKNVIRAFMGSSADPEGVAWDTKRKEILLVDGLEAEVYRWNPGPNGTFDDTPQNDPNNLSLIDDVFTHFDTGVYGLLDSEGIAYDEFSDTIVCLSVNGNKLLRFDVNGVLLDTIDIASASAVSPSGVAIGPSSFDPSAISFWVTDRGIDNGPQGTEPTTENDGKLYELTLGTFSNFQPVVSISSPADGTFIPANAPVTFRATATDAEDGNVTGSIVWESTALVGSPDCSASTATESVCTLVLRPGQQTVRAKAFDSIGVFGVKQIALYVGPGPYSLTIPVGAGSDDAEERPTGGAVRLGDSSLQIVQDGSNVQTVGLRFPGVGIPSGAYLSNAYVQFTTHSTGSGASSLTIESQAADNALTFTSSNGSISSRPRTNAAVAWTPEAWPTVNQAGAPQRTPDLSSLLEPVFNRAGWLRGNALALIITGSGTRVAKSVEGGVTTAPKLTINFQFNPPVTITQPADGANLPMGRRSTFAATAGLLTSGISWTSDRDGPMGTGGTISVALSSNPDGSPKVHVVTASVTDARGLTGTATVTVRVQNLAPVVRIDAPGNNSNHPAGTQITFTGLAMDPDDGNLSYRLVWTSSVNGRIGRGPQVRKQLTPGAHVITVEATDRFGLRGVAQITIQVGSAAPSIQTLPAGAASQPASEVVTEQPVPRLEPGDAAGPAPDVRAELIGPGDTLVAGDAGEQTEPSTTLGLLPTETTV